MKIFMSWSGDQSRSFAEVLKPWLEQVLPGTEVWYSGEDLDKGTIWFTEIIAQLETCNAAVLCITRQNYLAPWIHFEAGGMVKGLGKARVAVILLDMDYPELRQPLSLFNALRLNRMGTLHLVRSLNNASDRPIKEKVLERTFEKFWPELDSDYQTLFPTAHRQSQEAEPLHIVPKPDEPLLGTPPAPASKRRRKTDHQQEAQPGLFNGVKD
jgi:hypothetical protein